jgi:hypothetical protein
MPPVQKEIVWVGLAKQTAKGAGAASATYGFGVLSGKGGTFPISQDYEPITLNGGASDRFSPAVNRTEVIPGAAFTTRCFPRSMPLLWFAALGTNVDGGAGPHTHTATPAQDLPYLTAFLRYGSGEYEKIVDCKCNKLGVSWDERQPLQAAVELMGCVPTLHTAAFTTTNDESLTPYHGPNAGIFTLDEASATPAAAQVKSGSIEVNNNLKAVPLSKSILPDDVFPADQTVEGVVGLVPNDLADWLKVLTGSGTGTTVSQVPIYGSLSLKTIIDGNNDQTLSSLRCDWLTDIPDADAAGGPMDIDLAFRVIRPTDGSAAFTALSRNGGAYDVATY